MTEILYEFELLFCCFIMYVCVMIFVPRNTNTCAFYSASYFGTNLL